MKAPMIGLDIAKSILQVPGEDSRGKIVLQKRRKRAQVEAFFAKLPPSRIGIAACGAAYHWGRTLRALGHEVRLIPAADVKPFVKRNKNDARDAAAPRFRVRTGVLLRSRASRNSAGSNGRGIFWSSSTRHS